jgi:cyclophilin family peptidyl-prolyl cis-trans isomerase
MFSLTDMATSHDKFNAVLYTGFNALTSRARHLQYKHPINLNRHSTFFGEVFRGMEVVDKIVAAPETAVTIPCKQSRLR